MKKIMLISFDLSDMSLILFKANIPIVHTAKYHYVKLKKKHEFLFFIIQMCPDSGPT